MDNLGPYQRGYAARSRSRAMAGPVVQHLVVSDLSDSGTYGPMLCSGGWGVVGNGAGADCRKCVALASRDFGDDAP